MGSANKPLVLLSYASAASRTLTPLDMSRIVTHARNKNHWLGITGMLLIDDNAFLQVLEGEQQAVDTLYTKISRDARHSRVVKLLEVPIDERSFADWTMGCARVKHGGASGGAELAATRQAVERLKPGRGRDLIEAFLDGQWHTRVTDVHYAGG